MTTYVIATLGDFVDIKFEVMMRNFAACVNERHGTKYETLPENVRSTFLNELVATFRVNGFADSNKDNKTIFRNRTRELLELSEKDLTDNDFDNIWCGMCIITVENAKRLSDFLTSTEFVPILHNGTNVTHHEYVEQMFSMYDVALPPTVFLSYDKKCAYDVVPGQNNLMGLVCASIPKKPGDRIILALGSAKRDAKDFEEVADKRNKDILEATKKAIPDMQLLLWNNQSVGDHGERVSLVHAIHEHLNPAVAGGSRVHLSASTVSGPKSSSASSYSVKNN